MKKPLIAAAMFAAAFPGAAFGAGLVQQRELSPQASVRTLATRNFEPVGMHWRGSGRVEYRTRSLAGRWSAWRTSSEEDALPGRGGWRAGEPQGAGAPGRPPDRPLGPASAGRALFVPSPRLPAPGQRPRPG